MSKINLISFLDAAQRTIIGELISEEATALTVKNPVVVNITPQYDAQGHPSGQMSLQLLPVYFREFQGEKKNPAIFEYPKAMVTSIRFDGGFDFRLYGQYEAIFNTTVAEAAPVKAPASTTPVLKLFQDADVAEEAK